MVYEGTFTGSSSLAAFESTGFSAGRIVKNSSAIVPTHHVNDYLCSVRVVTDAAGEVLERNDYSGISPYTYCAGDPVNFVDPEGEALDVLWDVASIGLGVKSLIDNVKSGNVRGAIGDGAGIVVDAVAAMFPFVPGGVDTYKNLRKQVLSKYGKNSGLEVHHLIEQRFAEKLGVSASDMPSIVLTKAEHKKFTDAWRKEIGYNGSSSEFITLNVDQDKILDSASKIYADYPEILKVIEEAFK